MWPLVFLALAVGFWGFGMTRACFPRLFAEPDPPRRWLNGLSAAEDFELPALSAELSADDMLGSHAEGTLIEVAGIAAQPSFDAVSGDYVDRWHDSNAPMPLEEPTYGVAPDIPLADDLLALADVEPLLESDLGIMAEESSYWLDYHIEEEIILTEASSPPWE